MAVAAGCHVAWEGRPVVDEGCEACQATDAAGAAFGLCQRHLDEWLRSPERRAVHDPQNYEAWTAGLEAFIRRVRGGSHVN